MASFNHMDKSLNYFNGGDGMSSQDNDQLYYGRENQAYSSFVTANVSSLNIQQQQQLAAQRQSMQAQTSLSMNGIRNGSNGGAEGHYLIQQQQQLLARAGNNGVYGGGAMAIGPSSLPQQGMPYSRSLLADDDSLGPPNFDSSGFPALLSSNGGGGGLREGDNFMAHVQQQQQQQQQQQSGSRLSSMNQLHMNEQPPALASIPASIGSGQSPPATDKLDGSAQLDGRYGLMGLLDVIRMTDKDLNTLALGSDLTTFGLSLNSSDSLFPSFSSPHITDAPSSEPQFFTPKCYIMPPPSLKGEHLAKFQVETLFYMFYGMPRDILQATAAQELYRREWRYHGDLKIWLKARGAQELIQGQPGIPFVYFDANTWEAKLFTTPVRGNIATGLLSEEEVRVKTPVGALSLS